MQLKHRISPIASRVLREERTFSGASIVHAESKRPFRRSDEESGEFHVPTVARQTAFGLDKQPNLRA